MSEILLFTGQYTPSRDDVMGHRSFKDGVWDHLPYLHFELCRNYVAADLEEQAARHLGNEEDILFAQEETDLAWAAIMAAEEEE